MSNIREAVETTLAYANQVLGVGDGHNIDPWKHKVKDRLKKVGPEVIEAEIDRVGGDVDTAAMSTYLRAASSAISLTSPEGLEFREKWSEWVKQSDLRRAEKYGLEASTLMSAPFPQVIGEVLAREWPMLLAKEFIRIIPATGTAPFIRVVRARYLNSSGQAEPGAYTFPTFGIQPGERLVFDAYAGAPRVVGEKHAVAFNPSAFSPVTISPDKEVGGELFVHTIEIRRLDGSSAPYQVLLSQSAMRTPVTGDPTTITVYVEYVDANQTLYKDYVQFTVQLNGSDIEITNVTGFDAGAGLTNVEVDVFVDYLLPSEYPYNSFEVAIDMFSFDILQRNLLAVLDVKNWLFTNAHGVDAVALLTKVARDILLTGIDRSFLHDLMMELFTGGRAATVHVDFTSRNGLGLLLPVQEYAREVYANLLKVAGRQFAENGAKAFPNKVLVDAELFFTMASPNVILNYAGVMQPAQIGVANLVGETPHGMKVYVDPLMPHRNTAMLAYVGDSEYDVGAYGVVLHPAIPVPHTLQVPQAERGRLALFFWEIYGFRLVESLYYTMVTVNTSGVFGNIIGNAPVGLFK